MSSVEVESVAFLEVARQKKNQKVRYRVLDVLNPDAGQLLPESCCIRSAVSAMTDDYSFAISSRVRQRFFNTSEPDSQCNFLDIDNTLSRRLLAKKKFDLILLNDQPDKPVLWQELLNDEGVLLFEKKRQWYQYQFETSGHIETFPLTDIQHAYWIGRSQNLALGGVSCHVYFEWRIQDFDLSRFESAWNRVIERHGMMRACVNENGQQYILPRVPEYQIPVADLTCLLKNQKESHLLTTRQQMCEQVLDAQNWPLFDLRASKLASQSYCIHLDLDLLVFDVQSFHIVLAELARICSDPSVTLPEINYSFRDYQLVEKKARSTAVYQEDKQWWLDQLETLPAAPQLPLAIQPARLQQPEFRRIQGRLSPEKWQSLSRLATDMGVTPSAVLLAAFGEVLACWCESPEFTLNLTQFNRRPHHPDVANMVGDFTSVLLVSVDCRKQHSFQERALQMQQVLRERLAHSRFGGVEVMRELAKRQGIADSSLMPIVFTSLLGMDLDELVKGADLLGEPDYLYTATPQIWLDHQAMVRKGALEYNWIVIEQLFPAGIIDGMFEVYGRLLDQLAQERDVWLAPVKLPLPRDEQRQRLVVNQTHKPFVVQPLHAGFFQQAARRPKATALTCHERSWSYKELAEAALKVAQVLTDQNACNKPVAVYLPKSAGQVIAALGVMAAGAILVPCGCDWPQDRLQNVIKQSGACALLSQLSAEEFSCDVPVLNVDQLLQLVSSDPSYVPVLPDLSRVAYIIYTSGSTGTPKGVAMQHGATANTLIDVSERIQLSEHDKVFGLSSLSFDLAIYDLFATLACGATLVLPEQEATRDASRWLQLLQEHSVTVWNSVPPLMEMLLEQALTEQVELTSLRAVLLSGDWLSWELAGRISLVAQRARIIAMGGATEAAIWSNWFEVSEISQGWAAVPYGFPLANQSYYILDGQKRDRPAGVAGDLYIGGQGLAHSYWNDPERTAEAFVEHPMTGERLYRTGDIARYDSDGCIEFLGRQDAQVKLGGYRIELGEIESVLQSHSAIQSAVVDLTQSKTVVRQLAAWLVFKKLPTDTVALSGLIEQGDQAALHLPDDEKIASLAEFQAQSEAVAPLLVTQILLNLQFAATDANGWTIGQQMRRLELNPRFTRLLNTWHEILRVNGWLRMQDNRWQFTGQAPSLEWLEVEISHYKQQLARHLQWLNDGETFLDWLFANNKAICQVLREPQLASTLLFPEGDSQASEALYQGNIIADYLGGIAANLIPRLVEGLTHPCVVEIGAGIGGLTASTLPALVKCCPDGKYIHTDVSPWFSNYARERFGQYRQLQTGRYDINQPLLQQSYSPACADIVLAANVLHNAHDLSQTLADIYRMLKPGATCMVLEATSDKLLQWVSAAAVLEHAGNGDQQKSSPLLSEQQWQQAFTSAGFEWVGIWPVAGAPMAFAGQQLFLVRRPRQQATLSDIKNYTAAKLPDYMQPKQWLDVQQLPLSSNGKVDRRQLQNLEQDTQAATEGFVALETATELRLGAIWSELLGLPEVGSKHDFFAMGGDSLLATRLVARIGEEFGQKISIRLIFANSELRKMARELDVQLNLDGESSWQHPLTGLDASTPETAKQTQSLLCLHASDGFVMPYQKLAEALPESISCLGLQASGLVEGESPVERIEEQACRAIDVMTRQGVQKSSHLLGWSMGSYLAVEIAYQLKLQGKTPASLILVDPPLRESMQKYIEDDYQLWSTMAPMALKQTISTFDDLSKKAIYEAWRQVIPGSTTIANHELAGWIRVVQANVQAMVNAPVRRLPGLSVKIVSSELRPDEWGDCAVMFAGQFDSDFQHSVILGTGHFDILNQEKLHVEVTDFINKNQVRIF